MKFKTDEERTKFIEKYLKLAFIIAYKNSYLLSSCSKQMDFSDLLQEAVIGLINAIRLYDETRSVKFETYANPSIRSYLMRKTLLSGGKLLSEKNKLKLFSIISFREEMYKKEGAYPIIERSAMNFNISKKEVLYILYTSNVNYFNNGLEFIIEDKNESPEQKLYKKEIKRTLNKALSCLNGKERELIIKRFGLFEFEKYTLEQLGSIFGKSRETIRVQEGKILKKLRKRYEKFDK